MVLCPVSTPIEHYMYCVRYTTDLPEERGITLLPRVLTIGLATETLVRRLVLRPGTVSGRLASDRRWPWNRLCPRCSSRYASVRSGPRSCRNRVCCLPRPIPLWTAPRRPACTPNRTGRCWTGIWRQTGWARRSSAERPPTPPTTTTPPRRIPIHHTSLL